MTTGCCGCSLQLSTVTACIFGFVQSLVMLILNCVFLNAYYSYGSTSSFENYNWLHALVRTTHQNRGAIIGLLITAAILNSIWLLTSIATIIGNVKNKAVVLKVWVGVTVTIIITDIIFSIIFVALTVATFQNYIAGIYDDVNRNIDGTRIGSSINSDTIGQLNAIYGYVAIVGNFQRFGLIGLIVNIFLAIYTFRRAKEIENPPSGIVYVQGGAGMVQIHPGSSFQIQQQQFGVQQQQYGVQQQQYGGQQQQYGGQQQPEYYGGPQQQYRNQSFEPTKN